MLLLGVSGGRPFVDRLSQSLVFDVLASPTICLVKSLGVYDYNNISLVIERRSSGGTLWMCAHAMGRTLS